MQYDLSSLDSDADILSAELRLYKHSNHVSYTFPGTFVVQSISTEWDESSVTWDQGWSTEGGDLSTEVIDTFEYDGSYNGWFTFDVTAVIKKKLVDPQSSFGFMVHVPGDPVTGLSETNQESYFYSSEAGESGKTPHISITLGGTNVLKKEESHVDEMAFTVQNRRLSINVLEASQLEIYSLNGKLLSRHELSNGMQYIELNHLAQGCFLMKLKSVRYEHSQLFRVE